MKIYYPLFENVVETHEDKITILVIENNREYVKLINDIKNQIDSQEGDLILSHDNQTLDLSKKSVMLTDLISLELNQKSIVNKAYQILRDIAYNSEDIYIKTTKLESDVLHYIDELCQHIQYPFTFENNIDIISLFKSAELKLEENQKYMEEKLLAYMNIMSEFFKTQIFVLVNIRCFLDDDRINAFYKDVLYKKYNVIMIENYYREPINQFESVILVDKDLCRVR